MTLSKEKLVCIFLATLFAATPSTQSEQNINLVQCGGTIVSDGDFLDFPGPGGVIQGRETCVWTIHLDTMKDFQIKFTNFSVNSTASDCSDAGVRLYSLTNLVEPDQLQSHSFCKSRPPPSNFFLSGNTLVLIFYVNSLNSYEGSGFKISWEGSAYDNSMTQHISSYSTASSGSIKYPVIGSYERNLVATWIVKPEEAHESLQSNIILNEISLESCNNPVNPCFCDALIIYEINPQGILNETQRYCEDVTGTSLSSLESQFIVAFYTDFNSETGNGINSGFDLVHFPSGTVTGTTRPTTTTTEEPSSTLPEETPITTTCGAVLENSDFGTISYKAGEDELYDKTEECYWVIRIPNAQNISFEFEYIGMDGSYFDVLTVTSFIKSTEPLLDHAVLTSANSSDTVTLRGNVAIVAFNSDSDNQGRGFIVHYKGVGESAAVVSDKSRTVSVNGTEVKAGVIRHPEDQGVNYDYNELSLFLIYPSYHGSLEVNVTMIDMDTCCECDFVQVYYFRFESKDWRFSKRYCNDDRPWRAYQTRPYLYVFVSDDIHNYNGFELAFDDDYN